MSVTACVGVARKFLHSWEHSDNDGLSPSLTHTPDTATRMVTDLVRHFLRSRTPQRKNDGLSPSRAHLTDTAMHTVTDFDHHFLRTHTQ